MQATTPRPAPPEAERRPRTDLRLLALLIAAGAALRFATLDLQSFWYDEAVTVSIVKLDLSGMLHRIPDSESTPPLYYLVAWLWSKPFGTGEVGLRSLSALCGTLAIPAFYAAAAELASRRTALVVAALAAFNPLLIWYSQEARAYALLSVFGALSLLFFVRALGRPDRRWLALWGLTSALALATHYFAAFLVAPEAVWLLARARERRATGLAVGGVGATGLALLPLALHQQGLDLASFIRTAPLIYRAARTPKQYLLGFEAPLEVTLGIVAGVIAIAGLAVALRRPTRGLRIALALGLLGLVLPFLLALAGLDYFDTRNLILAWLPLATIMAAGLARSRIGLVGAAALCAMGLASTLGVALTPPWQRDNWRGAARALGPAHVRRAIVLTPAQSGQVPFELYRPDTAAVPGSGVVTREIALVSKAARRLHDIHPPPPPRPVHPRIPGLREVRRRYASNYTVILFRAPRTVALSVYALRGYRLLPGEDAAVLYQSPLIATR